MVTARVNPKLLRLVTLAFFFAPSYLCALEVNFMRRGLLVLALAALCGCGSPAEDFVGTYAVTGLAAITVTTPTARTSSGAVTDTVTVSRSSGDALRVLADGCVFSATAENDTTAVFAPGQTCASSSMGSTASVIVSSGSLSLAGSVLTVTYGGPVTGTSQGTPFQGTYTYRASGPRR